MEPQNENPWPIVHLTVRLLHNVIGVIDVIDVINVIDVMLLKFLLKFNLSRAQQGVVDNTSSDFSMLF